MPNDGNKSHFVGLRMTEKENQLLAEAQDKSKLTKSQLLLKGLELLGERYSYGSGPQPLAIELKELEREARLHAEGLRRVKDKAGALNDMIAELRAVDEIVDRYGCHENNLIQILLGIQQKNHWLPGHALLWVSERLQIPKARIYQIANFYEAFSLEPRGAHLIQVCMGTACYVQGSPRVLARIEDVLQIKAGETDPGMNFTLQTVHCLGCCALGPVVKIDNEYVSDPGTEQLEKLAASFMNREN